MSEEAKIWEISDTEEEAWGEREGGWPVEGIVGEEIDSFGISRYGRCSLSILTRVYSLA
jgi:hypothetical protein